MQKSTGLILVFDGVFCNFLLLLYGLKKKTKLFWRSLFTLLVLISISFYYFKGYWFPPGSDAPGAESGPQAVIDNYGKDIQKFAPEFNIPPEFAAALCMLESGGQKPVPSRYEKHVYARLKWVKLHIKNNYEHVKASDLKDASDEAMQNLASSWGPFQIMGYKCLLFDIRVKDLRGDSGVYWALKWMQLNYGKYIKRKDFKSAFHMHNAGSPFPANGKPRTYNPNYVNEGLKWMQYFKNKL